MSKRIGLRELRQNASEYLRRAEAGESFELTRHGERVAMLTPLPERANARDRLIAEGKLIPGKGNLADLGPPLPAKVTGSVSRALDELREERL